MPIADYSHWNEEAPRVWWEEEGKHEPSENIADEEEYWDFDPGECDIDD